MCHPEGSSSGGTGDPEGEGRDQDLEAHNLLKKYASDMDVHRSQLT